MVQRMESESQRRVLGAILLAGIVSACASIMGVEEPVLVDATPVADGGTSGSDALSMPGPLGDGCIGSGCLCDDDKDCLDTTFNKCLDGKCGQCTSQPTDTCPDGLYCLPSHECTPGCKNDRECSRIAAGAPYCNTERHQCVACKGQADCNSKPNQACSPAGVCADKCTSDAGGAGSCVDGRACCNGLCVDTTSDAFNCGTCMNTCAGGSPRCCAGQCKDTQTNVDHCGGCGTQCVTTNGERSCVAGSCRWTCNQGFSHCAQGNTGCETDTSANVSQCGNCVTNCNNTVANATGITCAASTCDYNACRTGFLDDDGNRRNGCETACGGTNAVCCPGPTKCQVATDYCAGDNNCRQCKAAGTGCQANSECCSKDCHSNNRCK
jgi:hypothetical protein